MRGAALALVILALLGAGTWLTVGWRRRAATGQLETQVVLEVERGGVDALVRAQVAGRRLVAETTGARAGATALAFADATLAVEYGYDTVGEAERLLARLPPESEAEGRDGRWSMEAAARALTLVQMGKPTAAIAQATRAAAAAPGTAYPLYALGRARTRTGDLVGAGRALEAGMVAGPGFGPVRTALAEVELDLGDARAARATLQAILLQTPSDPQALLLLDEAESALDSDAPLPEPCARAARSSSVASPSSGTSTDARADHPTGDAGPRDGGGGETDARLPAFFRTGCALGGAVRARRGGDRARATALAAEAARLVPDVPRLQARVAETAAQLGAVDLAATLLERARPSIDPGTPAYAWAAAAVALGRGRAPTLPDGPRPADPETRLLVARAALAAGGIGELAQALDALGLEALAHDADLRLFARLRTPGPTKGDPGRTDPDATDDPLGAYVDGLRAQLRGDLPAAVERFRHALSGHGDACRAVGEYVATLRALKLPADPSAWRALRAQNAGCKNLH
jgi:hypothetical protein